jgi:CRISPR-associated protein Csx16
MVAKSEGSKIVTAYFVSRHPGAVEWVQRQGIAAELVSHLEARQVRAGDLVLGTLPIQLVAAVVANGARYLHLEIDLPPERRGADLTADEMEVLGARLIEYEAHRVEPGAARDRTPATARPE